MVVNQMGISCIEFMSEKKARRAESDELSAEVDSNLAETAGRFNTTAAGDATARGGVAPRPSGGE